MTTSKIIEKKPLSNLVKDSISKDFCELFEGSDQAYTVARTVHGKTNQKKVISTSKYNFNKRKFLETTTRKDSN